MHSLPGVHHYNPKGIAENLMCSRYHDSYSRFNRKMDQSSEFNDLLAERRKDCDFLWASRSMNPLLPHKLPPEAVYTRKQIIEAVINDHRVQQAILALSTTSGTDAAKQVIAMINEMASKAHLATVRWLGIVITKALKRIFSSIYINQNILYNLKKEMQISQVQYVYAPSHRSYLDFVLLSYILFSHNMALPNIASGMDFYQMHIVGELLRKAGAFYMRRSFANDHLYKNVFRAYVSSIVAHSDRAIEFFIEGTRSRSLKSIIPKYGLLSIILEALLEGEVPDIHFIPISISYDRPLEELLFAYELLGVPKPKESTWGLVKSLSIFSKPSAYSNVFFKIGEPISAKEFVTVAQRKLKVLSPLTKLSTATVENLAYHIIDSHKRNTVLTPFNIISMLVNQYVQISPDATYTLNHLINDYLWCKRALTRLGNVTISTQNGISTDNGADNVKLEIIQALKPHDELIILDASDIIRLRQRHQESKTQKNVIVKGHLLSATTMSTAVSAINLTIYTNPVLSLLIKPAMATIAIGYEGIQKDAAFERYQVLKMLLSTEFVMKMAIDKSETELEFTEAVNSLLKEKCIQLSENAYATAQNEKLFSLLYTLMIPFIDAIYIASTVLYDWKESTSGDLTSSAYLIETQKLAEKAFLEGYTWGQHPYSLSLDLYNSTWTNLFRQDIIVSCEKRGTFRADKIRLVKIITFLRNLGLKRPSGSYNGLPLEPAARPILVEAKL